MRKSLLIPFVVMFLSGCTIAECAVDSFVALTSQAIQTAKLTAHVVTFKRYDPYADTGVPFPFYGNWCGPGFPPDGETPDPIDEIDAICRSHDRCYGLNPRDNCECDTKLVNELRALRVNLTSKQERSKLLIEEYFVRSACYGYKSTDSRASRVNQGTGHVGVWCN